MTGVEITPTPQRAIPTKPAITYVSKIVKPMKMKIKKWALFINIYEVMKPILVYFLISFAVFLVGKKL